MAEMARHVASWTDWQSWYTSPWSHVFSWELYSAGLKGQVAAPGSGGSVADTVWYMLVCTHVAALSTYIEPVAKNYWPNKKSIDRVSAL